MEEWVEPERYELEEISRGRFSLSRRSFMKALGAGLLVTAKGGIALGQVQGAGSRSVAARLHIDVTGVVTVMTSKVEMGQGARTEISQAAAEELMVSIERIHLVMADTDVVPNDGGTFGSRTTPFTIPAVRKAAAAAREILIDAGCKQLDATREDVVTADGVITHSLTDQKVSYWTLVLEQDIVDSFNKDNGPDIELTHVTEWTTLGTPVARVSGEAIVTGTHQYPSDIVRPTMLYGKVLRPPSYGATLVDVDLGEAAAMEGVFAVRDGDFVGCAAPTSFFAGQAIETIEKTARWDTEDHPSSKDLFIYLRENVRPGESQGWGRRAQEAGSVEEGLAGAEKVLWATYEISYIQHAPMEPRAAVAEWSGGKLTVWTGTQRPHGVQEQLVNAFGLTQEQVRVVAPDTGGGFGGKHVGDPAVEAARLAKMTHRPVYVRWTREEEFTWAYFRPAGVVDVGAGLDSNGQMVAWEFTNYNSGASAVHTPYIVPNVKSEFVRCDSPLREGSYRTLAATANNFAREAFMDELATEAGIDPLEFRLSHLRDERLRAVLETATNKFGWSRAATNTDSGIGVGLACGFEKGSYVAACAQVLVDREAGEIHVQRVTQAFECGAILNPANLQAQVEGCIVMGLGGALWEEIQFEKGKILNGTFRQYQVPRFRDLPNIEVVLVNRQDLPSVGGGETPIIAVAPAIANAIRQVTGESLRSLPLRAPGLKFV